MGGGRQHSPAILYPPCRNQKKTELWQVSRTSALACPPTWVPLCSVLTVHPDGAAGGTAFPVICFFLFRPPWVLETFEHCISHSFPPCGQVSDTQLKAEPGPPSVMGGSFSSRLSPGQQPVVEAARLTAGRKQRERKGPEMVLRVPRPLIQFTLVLESFSPPLPSLSLLTVPFVL